MSSKRPCQGALCAFNNCDDFTTNGKGKHCATHREIEIESLMDTLRTKMLEHPDLRLGQLICYVFDQRTSPVHSLFHFTDDELHQQLIEMKP